MNKNLVKIIVIVLSAIIVVGTVIIGFCTHWFGLALGPMGKLIKATKNTLSAKSFVMEITRSGDKKIEITYAKVGSRTAVMIDDGYGEYLIYDGKEYRLKNDGSRGYIYDMESSELLFDAIDDVNDGKEPDWDDIIEDLYAEDYIDDKHVDEFVDEMLNKKLTDKEWLEDYLGFDKDGNVFSFSFNLGEVYDEIIDTADDARVLKENRREYDVAGWNNIDVDAEIDVEKNKLSKIQLTLSHKKYNSIKFTVRFFEYGEDVLDKDDVNDFIDEVEEAKEEYERIHRCSNCGDWKSYGVCMDCDYHGYGYCYRCRYYTSVYDRDGTYYCYDCLSENFEY